MNINEIVKLTTNPKDAEKIKHNCRKHNIDVNTKKVCKTDFISVCDCISYGFVWDQTPEGFDYWADKAKFYYALERMNDKPLPLLP
jgi:hypothetical protein